MIDTERLNELTVAVALGKPLKDLTTEEKAFVRELRKELKEMERLGIGIDIPGECA